MSNLTSIAVSPEVKRAIAERGVAGQSLNSVLKKILDLEQEPQNDIVRGKKITGSKS